MAIGGPADCLQVPETAEEMRLILAHWRSQGVEPFILGGGCNTLFPDNRFTRPVVLTEKLRGLAVRETRLIAEAGVRLDILIRCAIESGLSGLEMFIGIPGTVGGAVAMNAGGSGHEFGQLVRTASGVDPDSGELVEVPAARIEWNYRSAQLNGLVVTAVELDLVPGDTPALRQRARQLMQRKASAQPLSNASAGCIFKNPPGLSAGKLIEEAGLKGERSGGAVVSTKHGNFIVNESGKASARDILRLIERIRERVWNLFQVSLELEIVVAEDLAPVT
jgi:UDP-N-acetylmuramate dehydrogenase